MGNAKAKNECPPTSFDSPMTIDQLETIFRSQDYQKFFKESSSVIKNSLEPIKVTSLYYWDKTEPVDTHWNTCEVQLTPKTWSYENGSFAKNLRYGCGLEESCCEASCCFDPSVFLGILFMIGIPLICSSFAYSLFKSVAMCKLIEQTVNEERRTSNTEISASIVSPLVESQNPPRYPSRPSQSSRSSVPSIPLQPLRKSQAPSLTTNHNPTNEDNPPEYSSLFPSSS